MVAAAAALMVVLAPAAGATTYNKAVLLAPDERTPLRQSGSAAKFAFGLSGELKCPTDSRHPPYYYVWGYVIPATTDVTTVAFRGRLIDLAKGYQLVEYGQPFGPFPVEANTGRLLDPGNEFSLSDFRAPDLLKGGVRSANWQIGITCVPQQDGAGVHLGRAAVVWNVNVAVTASSTDPKGFAWKPLDRSGGSTGSGASTLLITSGLIVAFLVGSALFVRGRRGGGGRSAPGPRAHVAAGRPDGRSPVRAGTAVTRTPAS